MTDAYPSKLRLAFSKAADYGRIRELFDPAVKGATDPNEYVAMRADAVFRDAVEDGSVAYLADENDGIQTISIVYHLYEQENPNRDTQHDYTEIGSAMARLPNLRSAHLVITALALKEWWASPPKQIFAGEIKDTNAASLKIYEAIEWEPVTDRGEFENLHNSSNTTLARDDEKLPPPPPGEEKSHWYKCGDRGLAAMAKILLSFMNQGGLLNKKSGVSIAVDFSELDKIGLTRPRLEALAKGITDKSTLAKIGQAASQPPAPQP